MHWMLEIHEIYMRYISDSQGVDVVCKLWSPTQSPKDTMHQHYFIWVTCKGKSPSRALIREGEMCQGLIKLGAFPNCPTSSCSGRLHQNGKDIYLVMACYLLYQWLSVTRCINLMHAFIPRLVNTNERKFKIKVMYVNMILIKWNLILPLTLITEFFFN